MSRSLVLGCVAVTALAVVPASPGGAAGDYRATASADGVRVGVTVRRFLVVEQFVDAGAPSAQAHVDSLGNSQAWAAFPFPGDLVVSLPGTVAGFGPPGLPALPEYPLHVSARHPTKPSAEVGGSGYVLRGAADEEAATASAEAGVADETVRIGRTRSAAAAVRTPDAEVRAEADSAVEAFTVGDVLRIGRVSSRAVATGRPGGPVTRDSETNIAEATVAGQAVVIGEKGITTPGGNGPVPDGAAARQALAGAGVTLRYLAPTESETGVVAAGVEVSVLRELPGVGEAVVTYVLGRASASAEASADPFSLPVPVENLPGFPSEAGPEPGGDGETGPGIDAGTREAEGPGNAFLGRPGPRMGAVAAAVAAAVPLPPVTGASTAAGAGSSETASAPPESAADPAGVLPSQPARTALPGPDFSGFVPILGAGGMAMAAALALATRAIRRASWT